jgi:putative ABC transport system permease protein
VRLVSAVAALLRRFRSERSVALLLFGLVAMTSFAVAAGPRLFNRIADEGLRYEAVRATALQRNIQFTRVDRLPAGRDDPFERVTARGAALRRQVPSAVTALVEEERFVLDSTRFVVLEPPNYQTFVTLRQQDGLDGRIDLVDGRLPEPVEPPEDAATPPRFELAISEASAAAIGVTTGDVLGALVDPTDPMLANVFPRPSIEIEIEFVGLFSVRDPDSPFWFDDNGLANIAVGGTDESPIAFVTALFAPGAYAELLALDLPTRYRWRSFVDVDRLDAGQLGTLVPDLRRLDTAFSTAGSVRPGSTQVRSGLLAIVERYLDQRATSEAALSVAALGPLTVAGGAVGLIGFLIVRRRRPALALARGRGASSGQLLAAQLWEGLLITLPAAIGGLVAALTLIPARASELSFIGAMLVALGATGLLLLATWPVARRARRELEREDPPVFRLSPRRLVLEGVVVALSLAAAWLLRERGLGAEGAAGQPAFDPFLAASPLLIGIAVGLLTIRLYPIPVRALGGLTARRRDLVLVLGLRNLGRHPTTGYLPLLILMLTVAIGTFSSVLGVTIERSQAAVSWQEIGADFRVEAPGASGLDPGFDPLATTGVEATSIALVVPDSLLSTAPGRRFSTLVEAIHAPSYEAVLAGSPIEQRLPAWFTEPAVGPQTGTETDPIPVIMSTRLPNGLDAIPVGAVFDVSVRGVTMTFRVAEFADAFPGIAAGEPFTLMPIESVLAAAGAERLRPNVAFVRGPASVAGALGAAAASAAAGAGPGAGPVTIVSRHDVYAALHDAPLVGAVTGGFVVALIVAGAYAAVAVVAVVVLHAQRRSREVAFLRTLGLTDRQVAGLTVVEHGLPVILALLIGVGLGLGLAWLLAPGIDLAAFSDPGAAVRLHVDWLSVAGVGGAVVAVVAVAVAASSWLARRLDLGHALRIGEQ